MKLYYNSLSKEEKEKIREDFLKEGETTLYKKAKRLVYTSLVAIILSIIFFIYDFYFKRGISHYLIDGFIFVFSIVSLLFFRSIMINKINDYAIEKRDAKRKKTK